MGHSRAFYAELESLRGLAAFVVLMQHIFSNLHPTRETLLTPTFNGIANLVITSVFGGTGAVTLFFVLSGFVLWKASPTRKLLICGSMARSWSSGSSGSCGRHGPRSDWRSH
jgi:peptidoglycan/LPS O-acetylase OafA/YrhL